MSVRVITPEKTVFESDEIESVTLPTSEGEITVLPGHIPLFSKVIHGEAHIRNKNRDIHLVTTDGFVKVSHNLVMILTDYAIRSEDIEITKVMEAKKKAEAAMQQKQSERDFALAEADLRRVLLELNVAQKRKSGSHTR